jgi:ABC-type sulfate/molybdate transport systems ATPase subunit/ABC-type sulfate transport system permease component
MLRTPLPWLGALLAGYLLVPLAAFLIRLAGTPGAQLAAPGVGAALTTSLITASIATAVIALLGIPLAYVLAHAHGRLATVIGVLVQLPIALPPLISGILLLYIVGPYTWLGERFNGNLTDNATGIVLAQVFVAAPFLIIAARSAFAATDPALPGVAATLGYGPLARFFRVALPSAADGIRAGLLLSWLRGFGEFGATVILAYHPYSLPVFTFVQFGSVGLSGTMLPTAATLTAALAVTILVAWAPRRLRRTRTGPLPQPRTPRTAPAAALDFDLTARLGSFHLRAAHRQQGQARHLAILGPSGSGKSLTVRVVAGLANLEAGHVRLGDQDLTCRQPPARAIGYLPQDPCLLPHLTVWRQVTLGVGTDPAVAAHWINVLGLRELVDRLPHQLSGGQRRRVALARALAREPRLLLLDEPFTGLDTPVRDELRRELRRLQRTTGLTTVLVTHDPDEAALLADEVLLISDGTVLQSGPQPEVFAHPATPTAARLLGARNVHTEPVLADGTLKIAGTAIPVDPELAAPGTPVTWSIDPRDVTVTDHAGVDGVPGARVVDVIRLGAISELHVELADGLELTAVATDENHPAPDEPCTVTIPAKAVTVWTAQP